MALMMIFLISRAVMPKCSAPPAVPSIMPILERALVVLAKITSSALPKPLAFVSTTPARMLAKVMLPATMIVPMRVSSGSGDRYMDPIVVTRGELATPEHAATRHPLWSG